MRPTNLIYRSPKERTGEFLYPLVTKNGLAAGTAGAHPRQRFSFPKGKRWDYIENISKRTGNSVGPGSYDIPISTNRGVGPTMRIDSVITSNSSRDFEFLYVGDVITKQNRTAARCSSQPKSQIDSNANSATSSPKTDVGRIMTETQRDSFGVHRARTRLRSRLNRASIDAGSGSRTSFHPWQPQTEPDGASSFRKRPESRNESHNTLDSKQHKFLIKPYNPPIVSKSPEKKSERVVFTRISKNKQISSSPKPDPLFKVFLE